MRGWIWILIVWGCVTLASGVGFYYLSYHPTMMLWAEEYHPSNAYQRGRDLKKEGHLAEALTAFRIGCRHFERISQETHLRKHRLQFVQGLLEMALVYREYGDATSLREALHLYSQATGLEPRYAGGEPWLAQGILLQSMGKYAEAIRSFTGVFEHGTAPVALDAAFWRGTCYSHLGDYTNADLDWYHYIRYKGFSTTDVLKTISDLSMDSGVHALYIHARLAIEMGDDKKADLFWQDYLRKNPVDRSALFYSRHSPTEPAVDTKETIPLSDFFPQFAIEKFSFNTTLVDVYTHRPMRVEIQIGLSLTKPNSPPAQCRLLCNGQSIFSPTVHSIDRGIYTAEAVLHPGANTFVLQAVQDEQSWDVTFLDLHSFTVRPKSME